MTLDQPPGTTKCHQCGSSEISEKSAYGSPLCARCLPIGAHVLHHHTAFGGFAVVCDCGWETAASGPGSARLVDERGKAHWREVLARTRAAEARRQEKVS